MIDVDYWIEELKKMEETHSPELDHKDCGSIAEELQVRLDVVGELNNLLNTYLSDPADVGEANLVFIKKELNKMIKKLRGEK